MAEAPAPHFDSVAPPAMGKYAPIARLGNGGMADVFLAVARGPVGFNKLVVVKRLRGPGDQDHVRMFLDEARLCARLSHPNIVNTYEVGDSQGQYFIAMEYLEGQPLQALLRWLTDRAQGLSEPLAAYIAVQALKGLHYAHELCDYDGKPLCVVHRDVSPHNLMLTYGGEVKLLDFGIAKAATNSTQTETGVLKGKIRYMAPEQVAEKTIDRRADLYAFGIMLWEMLARRQLYTGDSVSILTRIGSQDPEPVSAVRPGVAPALDRIVTKALRRDASQRYATAEAMRLDLEEYLHGTDGASDTELARLVSEAFADVREKVRERIKTFVARLPERDGEASSPPTLEQETDTLPLLGEESGSGPTPSGKSGNRLRPATAQGAGEATPAATRWTRIAVGALVIAALAGLGVMALRNRHAARITTPAPAAAPTTAHVHLATDPPGALVEIDGQAIGRSPADLVLDAGSRTLVVSLDGYETEQVPLSVVAGTVVDRLVQLRPKAPPTPLASVTPSAAAAPPAATHVAQPRGGPSRSSTAPTARSASAGPAATPTASTPAPPKIRVLDDSDSP